MRNAKTVSAIYACLTRDQQKTRAVLRLASVPQLADLVGTGG
jgi:hypothetical protein